MREIVHLGESEWELVVGEANGGVVVYEESGCAVLARVKVVGRRVRRAPLAPTRTTPKEYAEWRADVRKRDAGEGILSI